MGRYLFFSQNLLQIFEHDAQNRMNCHPEGVQTLANQLLTLLFGMPDVKHDEPDDIVVQRKGRLLRQLRDESDQGPEGLEDVDCAFSRQLLHEVLEEQVAVLNKASPDHLKKVWLIQSSLTWVKGH